MNDHNLDDLIIENIEPKNAKSKSLLTIIALLIVVFIVGIILARLNLDEPNNNSLAEENESEMISPELTLQSRAKEKEKKEEPKITDMIEEELNKPIQEAKLTVEKTEEVKKVQEVKKVKEVKEVKEPVPVTEPVAVEETKVEVTKEFEQLPAEPEVSSVPHTEQSTKKSVAEPVVPATVKKPKEVKAKKTTPKPVATGSYFIQVGSYRQTPSKRFLSVIKNNGFHYTLTAPNAKGIKKLLIGPYPNRVAANAALTRVRDLVNKSAFIVKR